MEWPDFEPEPALGLFVYAAGDGIFCSDTRDSGKGYGYGNWKGDGFGNGYGYGYVSGDGFGTYPLTLIVRAK